MTTTFSANTASRNCSFGIQLTQWCMVPVKSRNNSVMPINITAANAILIFLSIKYLFSFSILLFYLFTFLPFTRASHDLYADLIEQIYRQCDDKQRKHIRCRRDDGCYDEDGDDGMTAVFAHHPAANQSHASQ